MEQRVCLVTGAAKGIGRGIAERMVKDGLAVAIWDIDGEGAQRTTEELTAAGHRARWEQVDVAEAEQVRSATDELVKSWGHVDVLVNNAGWHLLNFFLESDEEYWARIIAINYQGVLNTCRWVAPVIINSGRQGRIIQIASDTAKLGVALEAVYSGAKGAVVSFSRALARELASTGVTVNVICPGSTDTPLFQDTARLVETDERYKRFFPEGLVQTCIKNVPLGKLGRPEDIAHAVSFFADPRTDHVTGQVLSVSGGETMY